MRLINNILLYVWKEKVAGFKLDTCILLTIN